MILESGYKYTSDTSEKDITIEELSHYDGTLYRRVISPGKTHRLSSFEFFPMVCPEAFLSEDLFYFPEKDTPAYTADLCYWTTKVFPGQPEKVKVIRKYYIEVGNLTGYKLDGTLVYQKYDPEVDIIIYTELKSPYSYTHIIRTKRPILTPDYPGLIDL
jgi:hypothetical protein